MTVSGKPPESRPEVEFVLAGESQEYIRNLSAELCARDGSPIFLAHDGQSATSSGFVSDSETHYHMNGTLQGSILQQVIADCIHQSTGFRIWWASDRPDDFAHVTSCDSLADVMSTVTKQIKSGKDIAVRWKRPTST